MRRHLLLSVGAATALGVGFVLWAGCAGSRPSESLAAVEAPVDLASPASDGGTAQALDPRSHGWELGRWYAYPLKLTSTVSFGEGRNAFDFDLGGLVQVTPVAVTPEAATLYVAVAAPKFVSRVPGSQPEFDKIAAQIKGTGCFFTFSGGRVVDMRAPHALSPTAADTYRTIGAALQFARTTDGAPSYADQEYDATGQYNAEYRFDPGNNLWHKRKMSYISILAASKAPAGAPARVVPRIDASEGTVHLSADGRPESVAFNEAVTVLGAQQPVHSTTSLSLESGPSEAARQPAPDWNTLLGSMDRIAADEPYGGQATIESLDSARIHGMKFEGVVAQFEQAAKAKSGAPVSSINGSRLEPEEKDKQEKKTEEESRLFMALAAILREQPQSVAAAVQRIKAKSATSDVLIEALGSASSTASESALVDLASSKDVDAKTRARILLSLSRTPRPDPKAVAWLESMLKADAFSEEALLGLGTFSRRLREAGDEEQAARIGQLLVDRLGAAQNTPDQLAVLRAITNSGFAPGIPKVARFLTDDREEIRVVAVRALQSMHDPKVDAMIADRMQSDVSRDVRVSALSAAKVREPSDVLTHAVEATATSATEAHVRFRAVEVLLAWAPRRPDVRATLDHIANTDVEGRIRDRAKAATL